MPQSIKILLAILVVSLTAAVVTWALSPAPDDALPDSRGSGKPRVLHRVRGHGGVQVPPAAHHPLPAERALRPPAPGRREPAAAGPADRRRAALREPEPDRMEGLRGQHRL